MANKFDLDGFSVSESNVCTASGGFSGKIATGNTYTITDPSGGDVRSFNPNTATIAELMDFVATMAKDIIK